MKKISLSLYLILSVALLSGCNRGMEDTSELYEKSTTRGDIVSRSGTTFQSGSGKDAKERQLNDAQNRLRTGGGLLGKKPTNLADMFNNNNQTTGVGIGMPINPYLWKGSLETVSFMPLQSADPFGGIIITDWYTTPQNPNERCKLNIFIKGVELKTTNLKVNSFCQKIKEDGNWIDQKVNTENNIKLENAILNKAKKLRLSQS
tara:strand:- start:15 stop:626 length:612 start_codon:yes stop_codon:yes gene_type:complete